MEIEKIFTKDWLCVGRVEEFQNPGDYRAFRIAEEPVLLCRDTSGTLHGFANVCRHRGVEIATGEGNLKKFNCPYHAWMYDLDGQLISAPFSDRNFEGTIRLRQLPPARIQTRHLGGMDFHQSRPELHNSPLIKWLFPALTPR